MSSTSPPKSVSFSSEENSIIPAEILSVYMRTISWEDDPVFRNLGVDKITLDHSTRIVQRFIRSHLPHWRYFNDEKSRLLEALDNVELIKRGELERVQDCQEDMEREAKMDVALEIGAQNNRTDSDMNDSRMLEHVEQNKQQVKSLEAEYAQMKQKSEELRKENKRIALDTFSLYEFLRRLCLMSRA